MSKIALRGRLLTLRRAMTPDSLATAAAAVQNHTLSLVRREQPSIVAAYVPVGREPGGAELISSLSEHSQVLLPVLLPDGDLDWARYDDSLADGPRGLREPVGTRLGVTALTRADIILVPALAVDRRGIRMGRGGGSYDRALSRLPSSGSPLVVALLHDGELIDAVPAEPHDRPVHAAITPGRGLTVCDN